MPCELFSSIPWIILCLVFVWITVSWTLLGYTGTNSAYLMILNLAYCLVCFWSPAHLVCLLCIKPAYYASTTLLPCELCVD